MNNAKTARLAGFFEDGDAALVTASHDRRYFSGFASSDGYLLVTKEEGYFLTDSRYIEAAGKGVDSLVCSCYQKPMESIRELLIRHKIRRLHLSRRMISVGQFEDFQRCFPGIELSVKQLDGWTDGIRRIKTAAEIQKIKEAQALTEAGFTHILNYISPGRTEREIALELEFYIRQMGAEGTAFDFIVVSGPNSSLPHGVPTDRPVEKGDLITMDFGARVDGWHSDMTRTVALGNPSEEQRQVYDTVLEAQKAALSVLRAGLRCVEGDEAARCVIEKAGYGAYFGHATGHGVGMEIHEEPRLSPRSDDEILAVGNVVTVEPGIYLPGKFGVRIEDMALITETGCENLTKSPKSLIIL